MSAVIQASGIEVHFPGCDVLKGLDLTVEKGSLMALLGENGAGKTTLIKLLTGYLKPTAGKCEIFGLDPVTDSLEIRRRVGYVSDKPALYDWMLVGEIGWFAAAFYPEGFLDRFNEAIRRYDLPHNRKIKVLSKGQRAKVALALALAHDPELLILDEPTSGLDPRVRREFLESMLDRVATGRTVLLSSHQISEVERVADEVAILHDGKFRVIDTLSNLRDSIYEVTVSLEDPLVTLPMLPQPAKVLSQHESGRQRQFVVQTSEPEQIDALEQVTGVIAVQKRPASLEELFTACTFKTPIESI